MQMQPPKDFLLWLWRAREGIEGKHTGLDSFRYCHQASVSSAIKLGECWDIARRLAMNS